ncbi:MAG: class I SAM-dependent DNA methyltransferase [Micrococcaceae bacterium]|uniref:class I SAM-dependent DNA methyltransferase n=1 Tax=Yaniella sp. TaxID=2773929 RepID=UPI002647076A|nr:DNA methyltransferase [Yaniella sp.]MDN5816252.1 class I SAM-dependent DNA methyltransferase [Yaniella sp.]MDN5878976.1 class I SAM-dependent DNA methyltransferase [Micrococcaceae bacterium]MDN5905845.1 class I SAM-dependent DNA methyltransferase [Micrococcaceae bacterium]
MKPLAWNEIRKNAAEFAREWADESYEKGESQSFWTELFAVYGIQRRKVATFETRAKRLGGGGFIDVFWPGMMIAEQKSRGRSLDAAEEQALEYLSSVSDAEYPRYVVTSDFATIRVKDLEAPAGEEPVTFQLDNFANECERLGFIAGYQKRKFGSREQANASIEAAQLMAGLYEELEKSGYDEHQASIFLVRTLFALFADDAGLWERDLFLEYIQNRTSEDGSDLGAQLSVLYQALNKPKNKRLTKADELIARFPYVNGSVFGEALEIPYFDKAMRKKLIRACYFNWGEISPAIFGSLFQAVKSKEARRELGEHYTTETNILKVVQPLFLDELTERFADKYHDPAALRKLQRDMGEMRFLDPACGCGNFLIVAYREMRALELKILVRLRELGNRAYQSSLILDEGNTVMTKMTSFYGIELEEWPATIARTAMFLVNHQANQDMAMQIGSPPDVLPLVQSSTVVVGNAITTSWADVVPPTRRLFVLGNPPFLGHATRSNEQAKELREVWKRDDIGRLDYVTAWFAKAVTLFTSTDYDGEFAFVSTNSITQGEPVPALFGPIFDSGWRIKFAHRTFAWASEAPGAAAVHCAVTGFDRNPRKPAWLYEYEHPRGEPVRIAAAEGINGYLVDGPKVMVEQRRQVLSPGLPPMVFGNMPRDGGHLLVSPDEYDDVASDLVAAKYLQPFIGARQLLHHEARWCLWLTDLDPADVGRSDVLKTRIDAVRAFREASKAESTRQMAETPQLFGQRSQPDTAYVCVPRHASETRKFFPTAFFGPEVICGDSNFKADDPDGYAFAVISSSAFVAWQKAVGGRIKSDLRFSNTLTWNTFPLPTVSTAQRAAIIEGGTRILEARAIRPNRSLADHYNPLAMAPELLRAHHALDKAVDAVFELTGAARDEARLKALFASYAKMTN